MDDIEAGLRALNKLRDWVLFLPGAERPSRQERALAAKMLRKLPPPDPDRRLSFTESMELIRARYSGAIEQLGDT